MTDIHSAIDSLSNEELDLLNSDPEMLAKFKAKHMGTTISQDPNDPKSMEFERSSNYPASNITTFAPSLDVAMAAEGAAKLGPMAAKAGYNLAKTGGEALLNTGKRAVANVGAKIGDLMAPSVESADTALMETLGKHGLKDIKPTVFNANERDAIVNYADTMKKLAEANKLDPVKLQEVRATIKDVLDNKLITPSSPTGQAIVQAKDAASTSLKSKLPDVGESLDTLRRAYEAQGTKEIVKRAAKKAIMAGLAGTAAGLGFKVAH